MNLKTQIFNTLSLYWFILPLFTLPVVLKSTWFKGMLGEFLVNFLLTKLLPKKQYTLIKNITLPTDDSTTQIPNEFIYSVVIFIGNSTFKTQMPPCARECYLCKRMCRVH